VKQGKRSALQIRYIMWNKWNKKDTTWWKRWDKTNSLSNRSTMIMIIEPFDNTTCFYLSLKRKYQKKHTRQWQTETSDHLIKSHKQVVRSWQKEWKETKRRSVMKNVTEMKRIKSVTNKKQLPSRLDCTYFCCMVFTILSFAVVWCRPSDHTWADKKEMTHIKVKCLIKSQVKQNKHQNETRVKDEKQFEYESNTIVNRRTNVYLVMTVKTYWVDVKWRKTCFLFHLTSFIAGRTGARHEGGWYIMTKKHNKNKCTGKKR